MENNRNRLRLPAVGATAVKKDFMVFHDETGGYETRQIVGAAVEVEHTAAGTTREVVVMVLTGKFVPVGFAGNFHRHEPAFFGETADRTVDRCNAEVWDDVPGPFQDFGRSQGPGSFTKNLSYGAALGGIALHSG